MEITTHSLLGTWRLASWTVNYSDGRSATSPYGESPSGLLTYSSDGFVQVSIARQGREPLGTNNVRRAPIERQIAAYQTYFTYAGPYEIDGDTVIHHILLSAQPELVGTEQHRHAELGNGQLVLSADYAVELADLSTTSARVVPRQLAKPLGKLDPACLAFEANSAAHGALAVQTLTLLDPTKPTWHERSGSNDI